MACEILTVEDDLLGLLLVGRKEKIDQHHRFNMADNRMFEFSELQIGVVLTG